MTPMELVRKLDATAASLLELAARMQAAADGTGDERLGREMRESAATLERKAEEMAAAIARLRLTVN